MNKTTKNVPASILVIAVFAGSMLQYVAPRYQLVFLGILLITCLYEIIKLKKTGEDNNKIAVIISVLILAILAGSIVIGKNYFSMDDKVQNALLCIAFIQFILIVLVFGYRIVIKSGDNKKIRRFMILGILFLIIVIIATCLLLLP